MHPVEMFAEYIAIEEELLTKVAPGMGQNLGALVTGRVTVLDMITQLLHVIDSLLANENCAAFEADETESFLVNRLHMASQTFLVRELFLVLTLIHQTSESSELHAFDLRRSIRVMD